MSATFAELAQKYDELEAEVKEKEAAAKEAHEGHEKAQVALEEVRKEMRERLGVAPEARKPGRKPGRKAAADKNGEKGTVPTRGLKKIIMDMLAEKGGMEVKEICIEVKKLIDKGDYETAAKPENIANNVAQAIHNLKKTNLIHKEEKEYKLTA